MLRKFAIEDTPLEEEGKESFGDCIQDIAFSSS